MPAASCRHGKADAGRAPGGQGVVPVVGKETRACGPTKGPITDWPERLPARKNARLRSHRECAPSP